MKSGARPTTTVPDKGSRAASNAATVALHRHDLCTLPTRAEPKPNYPAVAIGPRALVRSTRTIEINERIAQARGDLSGTCASASMGTVATVLSQIGAGRAL